MARRRPTRVQAALAQGAYYASQGRAVAKQAQRQRAAARTRQARVQRIARATERSYASQGKAIRRVAKVQRIVGPGVAVKARGPVLRASTIQAAARRRGIPYKPVVAPKPTPVQRARAYERQFASQGRQIQRAATVEPVLRDLNRYAQKSVGGRKATLHRIRSKSEGQRSEGEKQILSLHALRRRADVRMQKRVGFLPRVRYRYTPKVTQFNVMPQTSKQRVERAGRAKALARAYAPVGASQKQRAALVSSLSTSKGLKALEVTRKTRTAANLAPALSVLEQASRPIYATSGGARAALKGENVAKAVARGATLKERYTGSDVLKAAGVKNKALRAVGGFAWDVAADPLTYVSFGASTLARKGATKVAQDAAEVATRATMKDLAPRVAAKEITAREAKIEAHHAGQRAGTSAFKAHIEKAPAKHQKRIVTMRVAPGTTRTVKRAGRAVRQRVLSPAAEAKVARHGPLAPYVRARTRYGPSERLGAGVERQLQKTEPGRKLLERQKLTRARLRAGGATLRADIRPAGMSREQFARAREIDRERRAMHEALRRRGASRAISFSKLVTPEEGRQIRTAIERGDLESLKGAAEPIKISRRQRGLGHKGKELKQIAADPDRLYKMAKAGSEDWHALRGQLENLGVPVGWVGVKPPVKVPEVTANLKGAQQELGRARGQVARAEREQLEQAKPGALPGKLTPAQQTRVGRLVTQAQQRKATALHDFQANTRRANAAQNPAIAKRFRQRARSARGRAAQAQTHIDHWTQVAGRPTKPTRRVLAPSAEPPRLEVTSAAAPPRAAIPTAKAQVKEAKGLVREVKAERKVQQKARRRAERVVARRVGEAKGYFPRFQKEMIEERGAAAQVEDVYGQTPMRVPGAGSMKPRPAPTKPRELTAPVETLERGTPGQREAAESFSHDFGLVHQAYTDAMSKGISRAHANRQLIREGRPVKPGESLDLKEGEAVYHRHGSDLTELDPKKSEHKAELNAIRDGEVPRPDEYVVLPKAMARHVINSYSHEVHQFGQFWDRLWGTWKRVALGTPAYLARNAAGDLFAAYGAQNPARLAHSYFRGQRALNELRRNEKGYALFEGEMGQLGKGTSTTVNGLPIRYRDLALEAEAAGAIRQGRVADVMDQLRQTKKYKGLQRPRGTRGWDRMVQRVEDSARLATYIGYRQRGVGPEEAAAKVGKIHFDYGELTAVEKQMRRAMPFYTFTSRNIPRQAQLIAGRPGKVLAYEKARQEGVKALQGDLPDDYLEGLDPYEARQLGIPLKIPGIGLATVSMGLPLTDLNSVVPADMSDPKQWAKLPFVTATQRGFELAGPYKAIPELIYNYSAFYRDQVQDPKAPRTPIPRQVAWLVKMQPGLKKQLGILPILDKQSGELVEAWPKQLDYAVRQAMPGALGAGWRAGYEKKTARGFSPTAEIAGSLTGVRAKPLDKAQNALNRLYTEKQKLEERKTTYNNAGINEYNPQGRHLTAEQKQRLRLRDFPKVSADLKKVDQQIDEIQKGRRKFHKGRWTTPAQSVAGALDIGGTAVDVAPIDIGPIDLDRIK